MKFYIALASAAVALAACGAPGDGDLGVGGGGGDEEEEVVEEVEEIVTVEDDTCPAGFICSGDVVTVSYDSGADELTLTGLPFDDDPLNAVYSNVGTHNGFTLYENNDPSIFSRYLALHRSTSGGELTLGVATIEGYFSYGYRGNWLGLDDVTASLPDADLVEYVGDYAGFIIFDNYTTRYLSEGDFVLEVDFTDSRLRGDIYNRALTLESGSAVPGAPATLPNLVLKDTDIVDGSFLGPVESTIEQDVFEAGTYQGYFGGNGATVVGGFIEASADDFNQNPLNPILSLDTGVFIGECASGVTGCP